LKFLGILALASAFVLIPTAKADSVIFESQVGNTYTYDLRIDNYGAAFILDGFQITGLSGVTGATLSGALGDVFNPLGGVAFDADSVTVGTIAGYTGILFHNPTDIDTLTITSAALAGDANFSILDSNGFNCGEVVGPVGDPAPAPEPSSLVLLGSGLLGVAGAARRKFLS
jgi:PEP-CTERM motif